MSDSRKLNGQRRAVRIRREPNIVVPNIVDARVAGARDFRFVFQKFVRRRNQALHSDELGDDGRAHMAPCLAFSAARKSRSAFVLMVNMPWAPSAKLPIMI